MEESRADQSLTRAQATAALLLGGLGAMAASAVAVLPVIAFMTAHTGSAPQDLTGSLPVLAASVLGTSLTLVAVSLLAPLLARRRLRFALGLDGAPWPAFLAAPVGAIALGPVADVVMRAVKRIAPDFTLNTLEVLMGLARSHSPWLLLPLLALLPGLSEELFFRGMWQRAFGRGATAIALSALAFSAFHVDPHHVAGVLPLGVYLAWVAARTGSTWVTVVAHAVNNGLAILAARMVALDVGYGADEPMPLWWAGVGLVVALASGAVIHLVSPRVR